MADDSINVTLHFGVEQDTQGFQNVIRSLDKVKEAAVKNMQLKGFDKVTIDQYKSNIESLKHAIENSWDPTTKTFDLAYAMNLPEAQQALGSMQQIMDGVKISVDETGESFESGGLKIDKYSDKIDHFKLTLANAFRYNVVNRAIDMITNSIRGMIDYVIELDSALNSIRIITGKSSEEMLQFAAANQDTAKQLGRTATEYAQAALIFYQQGLDDSQVEARTNAALKLANITGQTVQETTNQMTAIWNNFDDGVHSLEYYEDVITALGATTASSSKEIAGGLEKFAAIGNTVGLSYEYAASALATVVATTRQSEDVVGTAFKTMFARLQSLKLGETLDDGTTLTKYSKALEDIGVNILDQNGNLKDMDVILDEIGAKWQTLDRNQQTALANTVGGVRQYAQFIALFDNFEFFKENVTTALQSAGTVTKQNEIYMESYGAKIKQIKATLDSIKFDMLGSKDFTALLDNLDKFLVIFRVILKDFGGLNQLLTVGGGLMLQMFLPQMIMKFSTSLLQLNNNLDNTEKKGISLKSIFSNMFTSFSLTKDFSDIQNALNQIKDKSLSVSQTNILLEKSYKQFGESGKVYLQGLIKDIDNLQKKLQETTYNDFNKFINNNNIEGIQQKIYNAIKGTVPDLSGELYQKIANIIDPSKITDITSFTQAFSNLKQVFQNYNINWEQIFPSELLSRISKTEQKIDQFGQTWKKAIITQQSIKYFTAASVAIRGLSDAVDKLQEGDKLGAVSQSLSSIGSALMMTGEPTTMGIGAALTAAGTIVSVVKAKMEKELKEAREERDKFLEEFSNFKANEGNIDSLLSSYDFLISQQNRSKEQQEELNNVISQLGKVLGDETFNAIAYYTDTGDAVYYTTEKVKEHTDALKVDTEEALKNAKANSRKVAKSEEKDINKTEEQIEAANYLLSLRDVSLETAEDIQKVNAAMNILYDDTHMLNQKLSPRLDIGKNINNYLDIAENDIRAGLYSNMNSIVDDFEDTWNNVELHLEAPLMTLEDPNGNLSKMTNELLDQIQNSVSTGKLKTDQLIDFSAYENFLTENSALIEDAYQGNEEAFNKLMTAYSDGDPIIQALLDLLSEHIVLAQEASEALIEQQMSLEGIIEQMNNAADAQSALNEAYKELNSTGEVSLDTISKLYDQFKDVDGIDELVESLLIGNITISEFEEQAQKLWNSYIYGLPILQNVTTENRALVEAQLENLGVTNAVDVVNWALANSTNAVKTSTENAANATPKLSEGLQDNKDKADNTKTSLNNTKSALDILRQGIASGLGVLDVSGVINPLNTAISKATFLQSILSKLGALFTGKKKVTGASDLTLNPNPDEWVPEETPPDVGGDNGWKDDTSPGGGGSGGSKGGGSGGQPYEAQLTGWEKVEDELTIIENKIKRIQEEEKNTDDIEEKIKLRKQESELLEEKKNKLHELNDLQRKQIDENIETLRNNGFDVYYDADAQELIVNNREHLHDLNDTLEKDMETMIKDTYSLVNATRKNSDEWREANKIIKDTDKEIQKLIEQQHKEEMNAFNDKISDKLFYTAFYEGLQSGLPTLKNIYLDVINSLYEQLNKLYQDGYTDADDDVQKIWKEILKYQKEVDEIDNDLFNNQIKYIDRILDLIPEIPETYDERMELVQKKVELRNERINELMVKGTESALDEVMSLYEQNAKDIEAMYKLMIGKIKDQQDELKDAIDGVVILIDEEIDKLKEEQETQKKINEEKEKEIELLKLKANLEAAQQQKTVQVYRKGQGFVWEANRKAIKDAEKALNDFNSKNEKDELQEKIDALEEYKKSWSSIPQTIEDEQKKEAALLKFGADGLKEILEMRGNYQKDALEEYRFFAEQINSLTNQMNEDLETVKDQMEDVKDQQEDFINNPEMNIAEAHKIWYADSNGMAPEGAKIGDVIITAGGNRLITPEDFEGAIKSGLSGLSSILITDLVPYLYNPEKAGTEITDSSLKEQVFSDLEEIITSFSEDTLPETTNAINDNTTNLGTMDKTIEILNTNLGIYTSAMTNAVYHGQDLVKAAGIYSSRASASADESSMYADMSYNYYKLTKDLYDRMQEQEPPEGSQNHKGIEMGPIGSEAGKQAFDSNLTRIARGDIKDDEMWALLQKGEAVFTPEQLDNMVGALNYSLDSVDKLSSLNSKMFTLGQMSNINVAPNTSNLRPISFGDINIQMHGVNDLDTFSIVLKNNVKSIFAQTLAKE